VGGVCPWRNADTDPEAAQVSRQSSSYKLLVALYRQVLRRAADADRARLRPAVSRRPRSPGPLRVRLTAAPIVHGRVVLTPARLLRLTRMILRRFRPHVGRAGRRVRVLWTLLVSSPARPQSPGVDGMALLRVMIEPLQSRVLWSVTPATGDLPVNLMTANHEVTPDVAIAADGSFVAVWESDGNWDGDKRGVFARRFAADGTALTGEFVVNATTAGDQTDPAVASDDAGNFAVTWVSDQGTGRDVFVRLFDAGGSPLAGEAQVNAFAGSDQVNPAVGMNAAGAFVVAWEGDGAGDSDGVWAQQFTAGGGGVGGNVRVNANTGSKQYDAAVAVAADGSFVVAHTDDNNSRFIAAQRFSAAGVGQGQFAVDLGDTTSGTEQDVASVASADDGSFVVAWSGSGASSRVAVRRFGADGTAAGATFRADPAATKEQAVPRVAADGAGGFLVVWQDNAIDGAGKGIGAAAFNADGTRNGGVFQANSYTAHDQQVPAVAADDSGRAVVVWGKERAGDTEGVTARRFDLGAVLTANQPPANAVPPAQAGNEDGVVTFSSAGGNAIAVADPDAAGSFLQVTLSVTGGSLTLAAADGLNFIAGDGTADGAMTFAGTASAINAALDGLAFAPPADATGSYTLSITADDQGNTGTGGALSDTDTVGIMVVAVDDAPVNAVPAAQATSEDNGLTFSVAAGNAVSVADVDAATLRVTLAATSGGLTLAGTTGLSFSAGDGTNDGTMTFTGAVAALNAALDGLTFTPAADFNGAATLTVTTDDLGGSGTGGPLGDADSVAMAVAAVNDAPVNHLPSGQSVSGGSLLFSSSVGSGISVSDVDAGSAPVQVGIAASSGTLSLASTAGLTFLAGDGTNDASMTFRGTVANVNAALEGMSYQPPFLFLGPATISITTDDLGNTGGGAKSDSDTLGVNVAYPNTAPTHTVPSGQAVNEDGNLLFAAANGNAISVADSTAGAAAVKVTLTATNGLLTLAGTAGLTFLTGDGSDDAATSFTGTLADLNNAMNGLVFRPAADYYGPAAVGIATDDQGNSGTGGAMSDADTVAVAVAPTPDPPTIATTATVRLYTEDDPASPPDPGVTVADPDGVLTGATVAVTDHYRAGEDILAFTDTATITAVWDAAAGTLTLGGTDTPAAYQAALRSVTYRNTKENPSQDQRELTFAVTDGATSASAVRDLSLTAVNDPPTVASPIIGQAATEDVALAYQVPPGTFTDAEGDALAYAATRADGSALPAWLTFDPSTGTFAGTPLNGDDGTVPVRVTVDDGNGGAASATFDLVVAAVNDAPTGGLADVGVAEDSAATTVDLWAGFDDVDDPDSGLAFAVVADDNPALVSAAAVDAATGTLSLSYSPDASGVAHVTVRATDPGGLTADATFLVDVSAANDPPVNQVPAAQSTPEDGPVVFAAATGNAVGVADVDAAAGPVRVTLAATDGLLWIGGTAGLTFLTGDGTGDATVTADGSPSDWNAALTGLRFGPAADFVGIATLTITSDDLGHAGAGGALSDTDVVDIVVNPVNDAPVGTPLRLQADEDAADAAVDLHDLFDDADDADAALTYAVAGFDNPSMFVAATVDPATGRLSIDVADDAFGTGEVTVRATDPSGLSAQATISVVVQPVADAPVLTVSAGTLFYTENGAAVAVDAELHLSDADGQAVPGATVKLLGYVPGQDVLSFTPSGGVGGAWDARHGVLSLTGSASPAQYEAALRSVAYENTSDDPDVIPRRVAFAVADPELPAATAGRELAVAAVDDAPTVTPGSGEAAAEATAPVAVDAALAVFDPDDEFLVSAEVRIDDVTPDRDVLAADPGDGVAAAYDAGSGTLTLTGRAPRAAYEAALRSVTYANRNQDRDGSERTLGVTLTDAAGQTGPRASRRLRVAAFNAPPVTSVPDRQRVDGGKPLVFSAATGNPITVADADSRSGIVRVMLKARRGTLALAHLDGLSFTLGGGAGDVVMEFAGTVPVVNAALDGLTYAPAAGYAGAAAVRVIVADVGAAAGEAIADRTVSVEVRPAAEAPVAPAAAAAVPAAIATVGPSAEASAAAVPAAAAPPGSVPTPPADAADRRGDGGGTTAPAVRQADVSKPLIAPTARQGIELSKSKENARPANASAGDLAGVLADDGRPFVPAGGDAAAPRSSGVPPARGGPVAGGAAAVQGTPMGAALDQMQEEMTDDSTARTVAGTASFVSIGLSVGYFFWVVRAGSVVTSLLSSVPAWKAVDPLPILDEDEERDGGADESLQDMVDRGVRKAA
jgi:hypothetical protein